MNKKDYRADSMLILSVSSREDLRVIRALRVQRKSVAQYLELLKENVRYKQPDTLTSRGPDAHSPFGLGACPSRALRIAGFDLLNVCLDR